MLDVYAGLAADAGATVVRLDGRDLAPVAAGRASGVGEVLEVPEGRVPSPGRPTAADWWSCSTPIERLAPLDDWVRTRLLPRLPATALTVIAGRAAPGSAWRADPAWRELLRVVSLRNLSPDDSRQYLHACGVDPARHDQLVEQAHGHPLGLSLLADVLVRGGEAAADPLTPDLVGTLLRRFVEIVPSGLHRRALEVCALARVTTEALLREVLGLDDAHELFTWLRGLSFVESGPEGVFPHDLARDALEADLRWRDPDGYRRVFRGIRGSHQRSAADVSAPRATARDLRRQVHVPPPSRRRVAGRLGRLGPAVSRAGRAERPGGDPGPGPWPGRGRRRRRSRRDGGSSNPRASSWSGARTA